MSPTNRRFALLPLLAVVVLALTTVVEANVGSSCATTPDCASSGGSCLGGFCCDPAQDATDAQACAQGTGVPLFASPEADRSTEAPGQDQDMIDMIVDNWPYVAGGGAGLLFIILATGMYIRRGNRQRRFRKLELAAKAALPMHQRRSHDAKIKPPTAHHRMAGTGTLRRKASDLMSIISTSASRDAYTSNHSSASSSSTASFNGHSRKMSRFESAHSLIDPNVLPMMRRNASSQSMNPYFNGEQVAPPPGFDGPPRHKMLSRAGSTLTRKGSTLTRAGSTLGRAGSNIKRKMGSFESVASFASGVSDSASGAASYFGRHMTRVQSRMHITRDRFGSFFGSGDDLAEEPSKPPAPRRPTGPPPGLGVGVSSTHSSRTLADCVPTPMALMPSASAQVNRQSSQANRHLTPPPPGMGNVSQRFAPPPPPPPPPPPTSGISFSEV
jgi:hypothetical protein